MKFQLSKTPAFPKLFFVLFSIAFSGWFAPAQAQFDFQLEGYIADSLTGQNLKGVKIFNKGEEIGQSNSFGYFSVWVAAYTNDLSFTLDNYDTLNLKIEMEENTNIMVYLFPMDLDFDYFLTLGTHPSPLEEIESGKIDAPIELFRATPQLGDEPDLIRNLHKLPGVDLGNEVTAVMNVRGGSNDQNLILYNGIPVYKSTQLFNTLSFQLAAVDEAVMYKGSAPARFGGRLSSVVDIASMDGIIREPDSEFALSLTSARFKINTPLKQDKSSMSISARRSYLDLLFPNLFLTGDNAFNFYDINFRINSELENKARVSFFTLFAKDNLLLSLDITDSSGTTTFRDGLFSYNLLSGIEYSKNFGGGLTGKLSFAYTGNGLRFTISEKNLSTTPAFSETNFTFGNYDLVLNADLYANKLNRHFINFGANIINHNYSTGELKERTEDLDGQQLEAETTGESDPDRTFEMAFYGEDRLRVNDKMQVIGGLRVVYYKNGELSKIYPEPRLRMHYQLNDKSVWKASYTRNNQFSHFISYANGNFISARWVPATTLVGPQNANQFSTGIAHKLKQNLVVEFDAYYKKMNNILISRDGFISEVLHWENLAIPGEGRAYGFELFTRGSKEYFSFMASYTLSWAQRKYEGINSDLYFDYDFDRRHMFKFNTAYVLPNDDVFAVNYTLGSGRPFSVPNSKYRDIDGRIILGFDEINNYRSPFYNRVDLSYTRYMFTHTTIENYLKFTVYNVFINRNASDIDISLNKNVQNGIVYNANLLSYMVIIPSISYNLRF